MKRLLILLLLFWGCEKEPTKASEPEIEYHTVRYSVASDGDTTHIIYKDQNGEFQDLLLVHTYLHNSWYHQFEVEKGTNLSVSAASWGGEVFRGLYYEPEPVGTVPYNWIYASVSISIDGGQVANDRVRALDGDCICLEPRPLTGFEGWCQCTAYANFAGVLW